MKRWNAIFRNKRITTTFIDTTILSRKKMDMTIIMTLTTMKMLKKQFMDTMTTKIIFYMNHARNALGEFDPQVYVYGPINAKVILL